MIEGEVLILKNLKGIMQITFFSLLILNMLLIFSGIFSHFFSVKDYTLIAGIIAFIGAIIGGSITLIGVKMTIENEKRRDEIRSIPSKIRAVNDLLDKIKSVNKVMRVINYENKTDEILQVLGDPSELMEKALCINFKIYEETKLLYSIIKKYPLTNSSNKTINQGLNSSSYNILKVYEIIKHYEGQLLIAKSSLENKLY